MNHVLFKFEAEYIKIKKGRSMGQKMARNSFCDVQYSLIASYID